MTGATARRDHSHKKDYWYTELRPLGIEPKRNSDLNDNNELDALANNIKQTMFQDYKSAYSDKPIDESHFDYII
jgi:hypothetical protein